jgi:transcriptional regulator with PAS, ATPase and Fis domain
VRIVAATQIPLRKAIEEKKLRPDLVARLDGLTVRLPPLRERIREVPFLFASFMTAHLGPAVPRLCSRLVERLCLYDWPFNVRELERETGRLAALHRGVSTLREGHLSARLLRGTGAQPGLGADREDEAESLAATLRMFRGNVARSAEALGISRQRAYRLMEGSPELDPSRFRQPGSPSAGPREPPDS